MARTSEQAGASAAMLVLLSLCPGSASGKDRGPNRGKTVDLVVIHAIGDPQCKSGQVTFLGAPGDAKKWKDYFEKDAVLGIHYVVSRAGAVESSIPEDEVANLLECALAAAVAPQPEPLASA